MNLHYILQNSSKTTSHKYISLTGPDRCNSTFSENIHFEKYIFLSLSIFQKICKKIKVKRTYSGRIGHFDNSCAFCYNIIF